MSLIKMTKKDLNPHLKRKKGRIAGLRRMTEEDKTGVDRSLQKFVAHLASRQVVQILLGHHVSHCVSEAFEYGDRDLREQCNDNLLDIFERYGKGIRI